MWFCNYLQQINHNILTLKSEKTKIITFSLTNIGQPSYNKLIIHNCGTPVSRKKNAKSR